MNGFKNEWWLKSSNGIVIVQYLGVSIHLVILSLTLRIPYWVRYRSKESVEQDREMVRKLLYEWLEKDARKETTH